MPDDLIERLNAAYAERPDPDHVARQAKGSPFPIRMDAITREMLPEIAYRRAVWVDFRNEDLDNLQWAVECAHSIPDNSTSWVFAHDIMFSEADHIINQTVDMDLLWGNLQESLPGDMENYLLLDFDELHRTQTIPSNIRDCL